MVSLTIKTATFRKNATKRVNRNIVPKFDNARELRHLTDTIIGIICDKIMRGCLWQRPFASNNR